MSLSALEEKFIYCKEVLEQAHGMERDNSKIPLAVKKTIEILKQQRALMNLLCK